MISLISFHNYALGTALILNDSTYPLRRIEQSMPTKVEYFDRPYGDGSYNAPRWYEARTVTIEGVILAADASALNTARRNLIKHFTAQSYLYPYQGELQAIFDNVAGGTTLNLSCNSVGMPEVAYTGLSPGYAEFLINLRANYPTWYSSTVSTQTYTTPGSGNFTVSGDLPVFPTIRITGPQSNPSVTVGDCSFYWSSLSLTSGQWFEINFATRTFLANSTSVLTTCLNNLTSILWGNIGPGTTGYSWSVSTSSTGRELKISYQANWAV